MKIKLKPIKQDNVRFIIALIIAGLLGYTIGIAKINIDWINYQPQIQILSKEPPPSLSTMDFSLFWTVMNEIETKYYNKQALDPQKMLNGAIIGMVSSLGDPYTLYLPPVQNTNFKQGLAGQFSGIGAELGMRGSQIIIVAPLIDSPSEKAGVKAGDSLLQVNGQSTSGWDLNTAVDKIRGANGTPVTLTVQHENAKTPTNITIIRAVINVPSVATWTKKISDIGGINTKLPDLANNLNDKIIYIQLSQFGDNTNAEWGGIVANAAKEIKTDPSIKGIVFDLRGNPGGLLTDAIYIASTFIKDGVIVQTEDRNDDISAYPSLGNGVLTDGIPLVVLINGGSASAAEIVSGSLRDHHRAVLVGTRSFGKGTVQEAEDLGNGAGLHVTIAKWLTPNGTWVGNGKNGTGLTPNYVVPLDPQDPSHDTQLEKAIELLINQ